MATSGTEASDVWGEAWRRASQAATDLASWAAGDDLQENEDDDADQEPAEVAIARSRLSPLVQEVLTRHSSELADLMEQLLQQGNTVSESVAGFLFGSESNKGHRNTRLWIRRLLPDRLSVQADGLEARPSEEVLRQEVCAQQLRPHAGNGWLRAFQFNDEPEVLDFRLDCASGAESMAVEQAWPLVAVLPELLELFAFGASARGSVRRQRRASTASFESSFVPAGAGGGYAESSPPTPSSGSRPLDARRFRRAFAALLPNTFSLASKIVDLKKLGLRSDSQVRAVQTLDLEVPLNFPALAEHYERLGLMLQRFDLCAVNVRHPVTGSCLLAFTLEGGLVRVRVHLMQGKLMWPKCGDHAACALDVGPEGMDLSIEVLVSLRLLGLSLAAVPLPKMLLKAKVHRTFIRCSCVQAGEAKSPEPPAEGENDDFWAVLASVQDAAWAAAESAANQVYDFNLLRSLFEKRLSFELVSEPEPSVPEGKRCRLSMHFAIPYLPAAELIAQSMRQFIAEQLKKMHLIAFVRDLLLAVSRDLEALAKQRQRGDEAGSADDDDAVKTGFL
eukprot:TRINITY_DN42111_c0_g1_i1.p1 TRINITY_DN42111_c0_g1~~TRINITY_DN42111_c0_g1_i1.p1  ORF type:complete len:570 (+),score=132.64 TRINITY_DN42111_c0_g1_i1:29-1711(+)